MSKKFALLLMCGMHSAISFSQTNIFPDTGSVGIGTVTPKAKLDVSGAILLRSPGGNTMSRPPVGASRITGEIAAYSINGAAYDDGLLRLSAGGGNNPTVKSFISESR